MKNSVVKVSVDKLRQHPYHQEVYESNSDDYLENSDDYLEESIKRTGKKPVYPIVGTPIKETPDLYWTLSGEKRLQTLIRMGQTEVEVIVYEVTDETEIKNLIIDLNKQRVKTGRELLWEFRHYLGMYPDQRGVKGCRYSKIAKEIGRSKDRVKDFVILNNFFEGEGDVILESVFGNELSISQGFEIKKVVDKYPDKFESEEIFEKLCDRRFDFSRLDYGVSNLKLNELDDFDLLKLYLLRELTLQDFHTKLVQRGRVKDIVHNHDENKVNTPIIDDVYTTKHSCLIKGDNREVEFINPFDKPINCLIGSPPYGNRRLNGDNLETDTGHNMNGQEYGLYLAETYERYKQFMAKDGSIYVIIDDFRLTNGAHACSLEHFVIEMANKGYFLVGRYTWVKDNPMPRSYKDKDMVNGFEMIYRFSLDSKNYFCNPNLFIERENVKGEGFLEGCTNSDGKGNTARGANYFQSHLKKLRNTFDTKTCCDIIRGNVANPQDLFRQADEKRHTSTSPLYLTSILIMESTRPGDLVVDIWNGVGNTMDSALLLQCNYVGVEMEGDYFAQACRRADNTEKVLKINLCEDIPQAA